MTRLPRHPSTLWERACPLAHAALRPLLVMVLGACLPACASTFQPHPAPSGTHGGHQGRASEPVAASPLAVPLDAAALSVLPRERVQAQAHGKALDCEGIALATLLRSAHAVPADKLSGALLSRYVLVDARDGYRVLYSLAELDPGTGNRKVYLVDRCGGKPLDDEQGPLRLVAPEDVRPARWVRQVKAITVVAAP